MSRVPPIQSCCSRGSVMVELAVVLPFILALVFFGIEIGRLMQSNEVTIALSRELGVISLRQCISKLPEDLTIPASSGIDECMQNELNHFISSSNALAPGARMIVTFYRSDGAATDGPYRVGAVAKSKFDSQAIALNYLGITDALKANHRIAVAEVYIPFHSILPRLPGISANLNANELYAYAVL